MPKRKHDKSLSQIADKLEKIAHVIFGPNWKERRITFNKHIHRFNRRLGQDRNSTGRSILILALY